MYGGKFNGMSPSVWLVVNMLREVSDSGLRIIEVIG